MGDTHQFWQQNPMTTKTFPNIRFQDAHPGHKCLSNSSY